MAAAVEVQHAFKYYGYDPKKNIILNSLNMTVLYGSIYGLLGASGCGKTTLLSCIGGRRKLNSGTINVLGGQPGTKGSGIPGPRVGYMPQEIALLLDFSVKEIIFFFGRIYGMPENRIKARFNELCPLLDLPEPNRLIGKLSGKQQRRLSFACALVHEPELLILDEPTVGLDPLLREKIWNYLLEITNTTRRAVIITTHYIEEAKMAHRVGLMRNGILLAEDSPANITRMFNVNSLDEAFLQCCIRQGANDEAGVENRVMLSAGANILQPIVEDTTDIKKVKFDDKDLNKALGRNLALEEGTPSDVKKITFTSKQRMRALLTKSILQIIRQPANILFVVVFPILQLTCFYVSIGANPKDLKIGVVNEEVQSQLECYDASLITAFPHDKTCDFKKISCRFIFELENEMASKLYYRSVREAHYAARNTDIIGYIHFRSNFTEAFAKTTLKGYGEIQDNSFIQREITVRLDNTDQQITYFLERRLREAYYKFATKLMEDCKYPKGVVTNVAFKTPVHGSFRAEYTEFVAPGVIMTIVFFIAAIGTSALFIMERIDGIWDRVLVAGITAPEMLLAHIITQLVVLLFECVELLFFAALVFGQENKGDNFTIILLLLLDGFAGMLFGLLISIVCGTHRTANFVTCGFFYPMIILCGFIWPIDGMPIVLQYISLSFPFTIPSMSMRDILVKGWSLKHSEVRQGFAILIVWNVIFAVLCLLGLKLKK